MNADVQAKLEKLKINYSQVKGQPFSHFFCPILFRDENVPLCKAHIVNKAFLNSAGAWTVQRQDIDNFYGSIFESQFLAIQYADRTNEEIISNKNLSELFKPRILVNDKPVDFFVAGRKIPEEFTRIEFDNNGETNLLGLKMSPKDFVLAEGQRWETSISKDIRLPSVISLIKSAHLTFFEMLGYKYALTNGAHFLGWNILGKFFIQNYNKPKSDVFKNAYPFFSEFVHMVRPVHSSGINLQGTITDKLLLICKEGNNHPWAFIVFVKTAQSLHAVMLPILDQPYTVSKFLGFLKNKNDLIEVVSTCFEQNQWIINKESSKLYWPKDDALYPE